MNKSVLSLAVAIGIALTGMAHAGDIVPVNFDDPNEGYNDTTAATPVSGNPGTTLGQQRQIAVHGPWVAVEVLARAELQRVHEDGDRGDVVLAEAPRDDAEVARVERAHRRDEPVRGSAPPRARPDLRHRADQAHDFHHGSKG